MKKNTMMRLASILLVCVLLTTSVISGTFAKYTSTASGTSTATVARWSFTAMGSEIAVNGTAPTLSFDLFNTIKDTGMATESDVQTGKIAPGTAGSFTFKVQNTSEVTAKYTVTLKQTANAYDIPIQYSLTGEDGTWKDVIDGNNGLNMSGMTDVVLEIGSEEKTHTIYWRWAFDENVSGHHAKQSDAGDTFLGVTAQGTAPTITIQATITATQVD